LLICILTDTTDKYCNSENSEFGRISKWTLLKENNPLPLTVRMELAHLIIGNDPILSRRVSLIHREHPAIDWRRSLIGLPQKRKWIFNATKSNFDAFKPGLYKKMKEEIIVLNCGDYGYSGKEIRKSLRQGCKDFSFLPKKGREYFEKVCFPYFYK